MGTRFPLYCLFLVTLSSTFTALQALQLDTPFVDVYKVVPENSTESPYEAGLGAILVPLISNTIEVKVIDSMASLKFTQIFQNLHQDIIGCVYLFPLHPGMTVTTAKITTASTVITAEVTTSEEATKIKKKTVANDLFYLMAEYSGNTYDIYQLVAGYIKPKERLRVEITVHQTLSVASDDQYQFFLSECYTKPYRPPDINDSYTIAKKTEEYVWHFKMTVISSFPMIAPYVGTKGIQSHIYDGTKNRFGFSADDQRDSLGDLTIRYLVDWGENFALAHQLQEGFDEERAWILTGFFRFTDISRQTPTLEYIIILDRSGSMTGTFIETARRAVIHLLNQFSGSDTFNIISFGSDFSPMYTESQTIAKVKEAIEKVELFQADMGGTDILQPIQYAIQSLIESKSEQKSIFLITDGAVSNEDDVIKYIDSNHNSIRVFTFGIGFGVARSLVHDSAVAGGGLSYFISGSSGMESILLDAKQKATERSKRGIQVNWTHQEHLIYVSYPKVVFESQPFVIYCIVKNHDPLPTALSVDIIDSITNKTETVALQLPKSMDTTKEEGDMFKTVIRNVVDDLELSYTNRARMIDVSKTYEVISSATVLVAIRTKLESNKVDGYLGQDIDDTSNDKEEPTNSSSRDPSAQGPDDDVIATDGAAYTFFTSAYHFILVHMFVFSLLLVFLS